MLKGEEKVWYAAFKAKDARFDGRFFVGVSSTGIYCRPVCRAKLPKAENCTFYATAAEAEQDGFRPCLLCRPELAPGQAQVDASASLARRAARLLDDNCGTGQSLAEISARLDCTDRHLRRAFAAEYKVSSIQYMQTSKLLLAKNLLTETKLSVIEVAMAAGFGSLRRFNDLFKKNYRPSPTLLRRQSAGQKEQDGGVSLTLGYRPPYQWRQILNFLATRAISGVETIQNGQYLRTVRLPAGGQRIAAGWVRVGHRPQSNALTVTVDSTLLPVLPQVLARIRHLFDLYCDPDAIYEALSVMNDIRPDLCVPGLRLPGCFDAFEMAVRAVLGQQITVKAAGTLAARLAEAYGPAIQTGLEGLGRLFPSPSEIMALPGPIGDHLGPLGITGARAGTILELARLFAEDGPELNVCAQPETAIKKLTGIVGIGSWTAQYIAMRALGWSDAFPHTDYGLKKALAPRTLKEMLALAEAWRPWRSYAVVNLWNSLEA